MHYSKTGISVRKTIVGKGVFAMKTFRKNQVIGQMRGSVRSEDDDYDPDYAVDLGDFGALEPWAPFRYLNHSCEPNAELVMCDPEGDEPPTMWVESRKLIRLGEQITIDYAWPVEHAIRCLCGSVRCRGWIVDSSLVSRLEKAEKAARLEKTARLEKANGSRRAASW